MSLKNPKSAFEAFFYIMSGVAILLFIMFVLTPPIVWLLKPVFAGIGAIYKWWMQYWGV